MTSPAEDIKIMGTPDEAVLALIAKAREWRSIRQPSMDNATGHRDRDRQEHQVRFELANAAVLWLWHQEHSPRSVRSKGEKRSFTLEDFVRESNRIEGILRDPTRDELDATASFINLAKPTTADLETFVSIIAPGHRLRDQYGLNVQVGNHIAPRGCPEIRTALDTLMSRVTDAADSADSYHPWQAHVDYETLHPFTDGNGRSGRALWLWQMQAAPIGFLHQFYYQTLSAERRPSNAHDS